jgi:hypothetical protein
MMLCVDLIDSYRCRYVNGRLLADRACASPNFDTPDRENQADALLYLLKTVDTSV